MGSNQSNVDMARTGNQRGQSMVEYSLILALISIVAIVALTGVSVTVKCMIVDILAYGFNVSGIDGEWIGNYTCNSVLGL